MMMLHVLLLVMLVGSSSVVRGVTASFASSPVITNQLARDCGELQNASPEVLLSGVYFIQPLGYPAPFPVYCDFDTDDGGWTVFQRRLDGSVEFHRGWDDYKHGFGDLRTEFWLGNVKVSTMTAQKNYQLRIELTGKTDTPRYAKYSFFRLGGENIHYQLFLGAYSGNAGQDSLDYHRNQFFTTHDSDNDEDGGVNCAAVNKGGWWFKSCDYSDLNGDWAIEDAAGAIEWLQHPGGQYGLRYTEMKIRAA